MKLDRPNGKTQAAMLEAESIARDPGVKAYEDLEELFHELRDEA